MELFVPFDRVAEVVVVSDGSFVGVDVVAVGGPSDGELVKARCVDEVAMVVALL